MKAAVMVEVQKPLEMQNVPVPTIGPDDALLHVEASGICRSDWHLWNGDWGWLGMGLKPPVVLGHEMAGVLEEVGANVTGFKKGDRVVVPFMLGCGHCEMCREGHQNECENAIALFGSFAEYVKVSYAAGNLVRLPDEIPFVNAASMGCRYMTAYHGLMDQLSVRPGEWLAVFGTGGVGMSAVQIASSAGARVIAVDIDDSKLGIARDLGAEATVNSRGKQPQEIAQQIAEITKGGANCSLDALGIPATCVPAILSLRRRGRHLQIGLTTGDQKGIMPLPLDAMVMKEIQFVGSLGMQAYKLEDLVGLVQGGKLHPEKLISRKVPLEETGNVLDSMTHFGTTGTVVIDRF
jgi:D-arabinose 1-dehydrogenase-like Zn-dependent alcohol dehydrogenase